MRLGASGRTIATHSVGIEFPPEAVAEAKSKGVTVGSLLARDMGCDPQDPHDACTRGAAPRSALLRQAVAAALGALDPNA